MSLALPAAAANAVQPNAVVQLIATYNRTHNGTGALVATITGPREVTITGHVETVRRALIFNENHRGISVRFNATMVGWYDANPPGGGSAGVLLVRDQRQAGKIYVDGGQYTSVVGGTFEMDGQQSHLTIVDGDVYGTVRAHNRLSILGGTVEMSATNMTALHANFAYISEEANAPTHPVVTIWADRDFMHFTAPPYRPNWALFQQDFTLRAGQTLTIGSSGFLRLLQSRIALHGGTLIIDGVLELYDYESELDIVHGIITGENAGELYGTHYADGAQCHTYCALCDVDDTSPHTLSRTLLQRVMDFGWGLSAWVIRTFPSWLAAALHVIAIPFQVVILMIAVPLSMFVEWIRR